MSQQIFILETMKDALRNTGYKSIESAMSEIIDNSIEGEAKDIFVILSETLNKKTGRKNISEVGFLDNGTGMDYKTLEGCLGMGFTTNGLRKGMGRFGVGLPQASMYACPSVEVYSWRNGIENCYKVSLDVNKVASGEQTEIEDPIKSDLPEKYKKYIQYKIETGEKINSYTFKESGTFVLWKDCDRVIPKTINFLFGKLDFELGRRFRYFIHEKTINIKLIHHENPEVNMDIMVNDPLFLLEDNRVLGNIDKPEDIDERNNKDCTVPIFEPYINEKYKDGIIPLKIQYIDRDTGEVKASIVTIKFSKVKDLFYDKTAFSSGKNPGSSRLGKFVKKLEGISIVRQNREIDFGQFNFYDNTNKPEHRWWGCEISFGSELDDAFGVANNKQHVELKKIDTGDYIDEEVKPIWSQLYNIISSTIEAMYKQNKITRENSRTEEELGSPTTEIVNAAEKGNEDTGLAAKVKSITSDEELVQKSKQELQNQGVENPTDEEANHYVNNAVNIAYKDLGKLGPMFDYSFELGTCLIQINIDHIFYKTFLEEILKKIDTKIAIELLIASLVKGIDETNIDQQEENDNLMAIWNEKLRRYINEQQNFAKK